METTSPTGLSDLRAYFVAEEEVAFLWLLVNSEDLSEGMPLSGPYELPVFLDRRLSTYGKDATAKRPVIDSL